MTFKMIKLTTIILNNAEYVVETVKTKLNIKTDVEHSFIDFYSLAPFYVKLVFKGFRAVFRTNFTVLFRVSLSVVQFWNENLFFFNFLILWSFLTGRGR